MTARYQLVVQVDSLDELQDVARRLVGSDRPGVPTTSLAAPAGQPSTPGNCTGGHGAMRLIPGGTAKSGPRIGQPYPAFWKCDTCGERQELPR